MKSLPLMYPGAPQVHGSVPGVRAEGRPLCLAPHCFPTMGALSRAARGILRAGGSTGHSERASGYPGSNWISCMAQGAWRTGWPRRPLTPSWSQASEPPLLLLCCSPPKTLCFSPSILPTPSNSFSETNVKLKKGASLQIMSVPCPHHGPAQKWE